MDLFELAYNKMVDDGSLDTICYEAEGEEEIVSMKFWEKLIDYATRIRMWLNHNNGAAEILLSDSTDSIRAMSPELRCYYKKRFDIK